MRIAFVQGEEPVKAILKHLNLWEYPRRAPPRKVPLPVQQVLFPGKNKKPPLHYPAEEGAQTRKSPALMAAEPG
jgi:hypothetical protein